MVAAPPDAIRLLMADHQEIDACFERYRHLGEAASTLEAGDDARERLVLATCTMLVVHATIEEAVFYPAVAPLIDEPALIDEAAVEHAVIKSLIRQMRAARPGDRLYSARFAVLGQYVHHHAREEENLIFPRVRRTGLDLQALGRELRARREALYAEATLPEEGELPV